MSVGTNRYHFYGNEDADVAAVEAARLSYPGIRTPFDLYDALSGIWCAYTCAPRMRMDWSPANRTLGQCSITAFLAQDIFGGKVYGIPREGGAFHCYNVVDGHVFDLTSEQFGGEKLCYEGNPEQTREIHFSKKEKFQRYTWLKKALGRACGRAPSYRYVLFDLDGTLVQSEFGIIESVAYALEKFGIRDQDREKLKRFIGPALSESFRDFYHFTQEEADRAVAYYREAYLREGIYRAPVYEGVEQLLAGLRAAGKALFVVTAKPQEMAETVLAHTGLDKYFCAVAGPDPSERHTDKAALIRRALGAIAAAEDIRSIAARTVMVGDRRFDIEGALEAGVDSIGVLYGYGDEQELTLAGATYTAGTPGEIIDLCGAH